jgi:hypothetical protein
VVTSPPVAAKPARIKRRFIGVLLLRVSITPE